MTEKKGELVRNVTAFTAACVLVSNMIGAGIFSTTGFMANDLGDPVWILGLWVLGGVFALMGAFCYSELGATMPKAGGEYVYIRETFGPLMGFLSGWASLTIGFGAAIASSAHLFGGHLRELVPILDTAFLADNRVVELAVVWALTAVHVIGAGPGGLLQRVLTIIKIGALVALVLAGVSVGNGDWSNLSATDPKDFGLSTALVSFMFVTFSYSGWNAASYIAGEIKSPAKSLPRAMIWGSLCVGALYLALNIVYLYAMPVTELAGDPIALVGHKTAEALFGPGIGVWFTVMLTLSVLGAASAMIWAGPRVYFAMAQDGVFPRYFASTGEKSGVPSRSIVLQSAWVSVLVLAAGLQSLLLYASFVLILFSAVAVLAVIFLRRKDPNRERPYRTRGYPFTPIAFVALSAAILWASIIVRPTESMWGIVTVIGGIPFYFWWSRGKS